MFLSPTEKVLYKPPPAINILYKNPTSFLLMFSKPIPAISKSFKLSVSVGISEIFISVEKYLLISSPSTIFLKINGCKLCLYNSNVSLEQLLLKLISSTIASICSVILPLIFI